MATRLKEYFEMCWKNRTIEEEQLNAAVSKQYITKVEKQDILKLPRNPT